MSQFKSKIQSIRQTKLQQQNYRNQNNQQCTTQLKLRAYCSASPKHNISPIIIQKKEKAQKKQHFETKKIVKKVQPFVPIQIPVSPRKKLDKKLQELYQNTQTSTPNNNRQIEIHIDDKDEKECLKKLFKKVHQLTEDLANSQKQRIRLELELNNYKNIDGINRGNEKDIIKLEGQNYRLKSQNDFLKELLSQKNAQINAVKNKTPNQIIKQIVVEKPVQVRVQVPKYVPGPEKVVQIPKYIQNKAQERENQDLRKRIKQLQSQLLLQKRNFAELEKRPPRQIEVPAIVQKPVYLDKPIYIDRPIYIQKPIQKQRIVQVPLEVPYQVPVYIEKPSVDHEMIMRISQFEKQMEQYKRQNDELRRQNNQLKIAVQQVKKNLEILYRHNSQKNHEVQLLLTNVEDYNPIKISQLIKKQTKIIQGNRGRNQYLHRDRYSFHTFNQI